MVFWGAAAAGVGERACAGGRRASPRRVAAGLEESRLEKESGGCVEARPVCQPVGPRFLLVGPSIVHQ